MDQLSDFLFTKETIRRRDRILQILQAEKVFDKSQNYFQGRVARFQTALARAKRLRQLCRKHNFNQEDLKTATDLIGEPGPLWLARFHVLSDPA